MKQDQPLIVLWDTSNGDIRKVIRCSKEINTHRAGLAALDETDIGALTKGNLGIGFIDERGWIAMSSEKAAIAKKRFEKMIGSGQV